MNARRIGIIAGSIRKDSFSGKMARALSKLAPEGLTMEEVEISRLPMYNQDYDDDNKPPAEWVSFRENIKRLDGILFVTPEYNRSVPAALKNALDVGSRPFGQSVWNGKPCAVASISQGAMGGFGANHHLRQTLVFLNLPAMQQPEAYIGNVASLFDADGELIHPGTREFLQTFMNAFAVWVEIHI